MRKLGLLTLAAPLALGFFGVANAAPITTPPPALTATGDVQAVYVFADAGDTSILGETTPTPFPQIFCNHSTGGCTGGAAGNVVDLGNQSGSLVFSLDNITKATSYLSNVADSDGNFHALVTTNYGDFGVGSLPAVVDAYIAGLPSGTAVTFVGWEDRNQAQGSDFDYNDLIFAFTNTTTTPPVPTPEPATLSLLGAGILGFAVMRRRQRRKDA
jgi:hypothetical protein